MFGKLIGSFFGPVGTAIGGVADGLFGRNQEKQDAQGQVYEAQRQRDQEYARQKEFAQMGIRWRTEDAKAAGLHPLAAVGSIGASYSPTIAIPAGGRSSSAWDAMPDMGQNLNRAKVATMTETERRMEDLALRNAELRNELLEAQIAGLRQPINPPLPDSTGARVGPVGSVVVKPSQVISSSPGRPHLEAGKTPGFQDVKIGGGASLRLPNQQTAEILENIGPGFGAAITGLSAARELIHGPEKPETSLPKGYVWKWNPFSQSFRAVKERESRKDVNRSRWTPQGIARERFKGGASGSW